MKMLLGHLVLITSWIVLLSTNTKTENITEKIENITISDESSTMIPEEGEGTSIF